MNDFGEHNRNLKNHQQFGPVINGLESAHNVDADSALKNDKNGRNYDVLEVNSVNGNQINMPAAENNGIENALAQLLKKLDTMEKRIDKNQQIINAIQNRNTVSGTSSTNRMQFPEIPSIQSHLTPLKNSSHSRAPIPSLFEVGNGINQEWNGQNEVESNGYGNRQVAARSNQNANNDLNDFTAIMSRFCTNMERQTGELIQANQCQQFVQLSSAISDLHGTEGRAKMESFFNHFEAVTLGWSDSRRAHLLAIHLKGHARNVFDGLSPQFADCYSTIKDQLLTHNKNIDSLRYKAQMKLNSGVKPERGENLMEYGYRILALYKDAMISELPEVVLEDLTKTYFLQHLDNIQIHNALIPSHKMLTFHQLIDMAEELRDRMDWQWRHAQNRPNHYNNLGFGHNLAFYDSNTRPQFNTHLQSNSHNRHSNICCQYNPHPKVNFNVVRPENLQGKEVDEGADADDDDIFEQYRKQMSGIRTDRANIMPMLSVTNVDSELVNNGHMLSSIKIDPQCNTLMTNVGQQECPNLNCGGGKVPARWPPQNLSPVNTGSKKKESEMIEKPVDWAFRNRPISFDQPEESIRSHHPSFGNKVNSVVNKMKHSDPYSCRQKRRKRHRKHHRACSVDRTSAFGEQFVGGPGEGDGQLERFNWGRDSPLAAYVRWMPP